MASQIEVTTTGTGQRQPLEEMGRIATRMLLEYIEDPQRPIERVELPTELVLR